MDDAVGSNAIDRVDARGHFRRSQILAVNLVESESTRTRSGATDVHPTPMAEPADRQEATPALERRREPRIPRDDPAFMRQFNPVGALRLQIRVLNVSKGGLKLQLPEFVEPGTVVQICMPEAFAMAEVRYCQPAGREFHAGVEIQDVFRREEAGFVFEKRPTDQFRI